jgi:hypothetical protein
VPTLESRNNGARRAAVGRQRLCKHVSAAINTHSTIELLDEVISLWSVWCKILNMWLKESRRLGLPRTYSIFLKYLLHQRFTLFRLGPFILPDPATTAICLLSFDLVASLRNTLQSLRSKF